MKDNLGKFLGISLFFIAILALLACFLGRYPTLPWAAANKDLSNPLAIKIILNIRIPRILFALILGAALGGGGYIFQTIFHNPLVEPGFLGVSQGAAFGAAMVIMAGNSTLLITQLAALCFGTLGLVFASALSRKFNFGDSILRLVLAGIAVSAFFSSGLGLIKYLADPIKRLQEIVFWMLGSLSSVSWTEVLIIGPIFIAITIILALMRWKILLLSMDEKVIQTLDPNSEKKRFLILGLTVVMVSLVIAVAGIVSWIGLVIPHIAMRITKSNNSFSLAFAMVIGAGFSLVCDTIARALFAGEIPLGIITALIGAVIFVIIFSRSQSQYLVKK